MVGKSSLRTVLYANRLHAFDNSSKIYGFLLQTLTL